MLMGGALVVPDIWIGVIVLAVLVWGILGMCDSPMYMREVDLLIQDELN